MKLFAIKEDRSLCRPLGPAGVFLLIREANQLGVNYLRILLISSLYFLVPIPAFADSWQIVLLEPKNFWLIPAILVIEYPLVHVLCNGQVVRALVAVGAMNALSALADGGVQMTLMTRVGGLDHWMHVLVSWTVITAIETIVLLMRQTKGIGIVGVFFWTGILNAATMWLVFKYTL